MSDSLSLELFIRKKTNISLNGVLLDVSKGVDSELGAESNYILVSKVEFFVSCTVRVDIRVDQGNGQYEFSHTGLYCCECGIIHASWISCCITTSNSYFECFEQISRYFSLHCKLMAERRTEWLVHTKLVETGFQFHWMWKVSFGAGNKGDRGLVWQIETRCKGLLLQGKVKHFWGCV